MSHKVNIALFILWPIIAAWLSFRFSLNALLSPVVFYGIPSILLSFLKPSQIKKSLLVSALFLPAMIVIDYVAERTGTWTWPLPDSFFSFRFFGYVSIEVLVWVFLHIYFVVMFYQYFFEKKVLKKILDRKSEEAMLMTVIYFLVFIVTLLLSPVVLNVPYWYLVFGAFGILPAVIIEEYKYPKVFHRLLKTAIYFFYVNITYELVALNIGWWSFPSKEFIGYVSFLGKTFPFEEFLFWLVLFTLSVLSYYEYFFNREK